MPWKPILPADLRDEAVDVVRAIAADLSRAEVAPATLARGKAGLAVFFAYLEQAGMGGGDRAEALLGEAIEALADEPMGSSLYSGFTGIAWAAEHLAAAEDGEDANEEIDRALHEHLSRTPWQQDYDLVIGLVGHGVYGLQRSARPGGRAVVALAVERLAELARPVDGQPGLTWHTTPELMVPETRLVEPRGHYNVGLAHGVPGVIALLGLAIQAGIAADRARPILDGAVEWLLAQRLPGSPVGEFPTAVGIPPEQRTAVRAGWCYGDPGVAAALFLAARAAGVPAWEAVALEVARSVAGRPEESCGVVDGSACHGSAGLALIYDRLFQATGEEPFREASVRWARRLLRDRRPGHGFGGYQAWMPKAYGDLKEGWNDDPGLLTGSAGIGLTLLCLATEHEPRWDGMLMTSIPPA